MRSYFDKVIPKLNFKSMQDYIVHYGSSLAEFITKDKKKVLDYIEKNNLEITEIKFEKNFNGLNDYRIILRKR